MINKTEKNRQIVAKKQGKEKAYITEAGARNQRQCCECNLAVCPPKMDHRGGWEVGHKKKTGTENRRGRELNLREKARWGYFFIQIQLVIISIERENSREDSF